MTFPPTQPLDLENSCLSIHVFALNDDGPSTLTLEEDEELSAANHWLLPAGNIDSRVMLDASTFKPYDLEFGHRYYAKSPLKICFCFFDS